MSDGLTHERYALAGLASLTATCLIANTVYNFPPEIYITIPGGIFAFLIDSDMIDQHQVTTRGEHRLYNIFPPLGFIVECWSYPLARLFVHRSIFSHLPGLNTAVRLLYYLGIVLYLFYGTEIFYTIYNNYSDYLFYFYIGGVIIDSIHCTLDSWKMVWLN